MEKSLWVSLIIISVILAALAMQADSQRLLFDKKKIIEWDNVKSQPKAFIVEKSSASSLVQPSAVVEKGKSDLSLRKFEKSNGLEYRIYKQSYKSVPVYGGAVTSITNKKAMLVDNEAYPDINIDVSSYKIAKEDLQNLVGDYLKTELVVLPLEESAPIEYKLAWKTDLPKNETAPEQLTAFIDANTGEVIKKINNVLDVSGHSTGQIFPEYPSQQKQTVPFYSQYVYVKGDESMLYSGTGSDINNTATLPGFYFGTSSTIKYNIKHDTEKNYDFVFLEASTDNQTWSKLKNYTGFADWKSETVDLSQFTGYLKLRFRYETDAYITGQGAYIENIEVLSTNGNVLLNSTASGLSNITLDGFSSLDKYFTTNSSGFYDSGAYSGSEISSYLNGPFVDVLNKRQARASLTSPINSQTIDIDWSGIDSSHMQEESNVFYHVNKVHDFFTSGKPFNVTGLNYPIKAYVQAGTCNAFYTSGYGLEFGGNGNGCKSTALSSDIVYHEYTHGVIDALLPGQWYSGEGGSMNEGLADYFAGDINNNSLIAEDSILGSGYPYLRNLNNTNKYPDDYNGEAHNGGEIFGGANWDLRGLIGSDKTNELIMLALKAEPQTFSSYLNAMIMADDNNGNLDDGTPNVNEICSAFQTKHGIKSALCDSFIKVEGGDVLLVADGGDKNKYVPLLTSLKLNYSIWEYPFPPGKNTLLNFSAVIWTAGNSYTALSLNEQNVLSQYLEAGGKLLLTGSEVGADLQYSDLQKKYLKTETFGGTYASKTEGDSGELFNGLKIDLNSGFKSVISPLITQATASELYQPKDLLIYVSSKGEEPAGVYFDSSNYKTIYLGFDIGDIIDSQTRLEVLNRSLKWLTDKLVVVSPENKTYFTENITVVVDTVTPADNLNISVNGDKNALGPGKDFMFKLPQLWDGEFILEAVSQKGPVKTSRFVPFKVDIAGPSANIEYSSYHPDGVYTNSSWLSVSYKDVSRVNTTSMRLALDNIDMKNLTYTNQFVNITKSKDSGLDAIVYNNTVDGLSEGQHLVQLEIEDEYNHKSSYNWTLVKDTEIPSITGFSVEPKVFGPETPQINFSAFVNDINLYGHRFIVSPDTVSELPLDNKIISLASLGKTGFSEKLWKPSTYILTDNNNSLQVFPTEIDGLLYVQGSVEVVVSPQNRASLLPAPQRPPRAMTTVYALFNATTLKPVDFATEGGLPADIDITRFLVSKLFGLTNGPTDYISFDASSLSLIPKPVPTGKLKVTAIAEDKAGNTLYETTEIFSDSTPPFVELSNRTEANESIYIKLVADDQSGLRKVWIEAKKLYSDKKYIFNTTSIPENKTFESMINTSGMDSGYYSLNLKAQDIFGNTATRLVAGMITVLPKASSSTSSGGGTIVKSSFKNESVVMPSGKFKYDAMKSETNMVLEINLRNDSVGSVNVMEFKENPVSKAIQRGFGYKEILVDENITGNMELAEIKFFYTDSDLSSAGVSESTIKPYYYNETSGNWELMQNYTVNTDENSVAFNSTHFSLYTLSGDAPSTSNTNTNSNNNDSGGSSSNGGSSSSNNNNDGAYYPSAKESVKAVENKTSDKKTEPNPAIENKKEEPKALVEVPSTLKKPTKPEVETTTGSGLSGFLTGGTASIVGGVIIVLAVGLFFVRKRRIKKRLTNDLSA